MPHVAKPDKFSQDIIIPGRVSDPDGFITEHREIEGLTGPIKVYFSVNGLRHLASKYPVIGLVPATEVALRDKQIADLESALTEANKELDALRAQTDRIAGFAAEGYRIQKIMGRPKEK